MDKPQADMRPNKQRFAHDDPLRAGARRLNRQQGNIHTNLNVSSRGFAARNPPVFSRPHFGHSLTGRPWRPGATSAIEKLTQPFADRIFLIPNGSLPDQLFEFGRSRRSCCPVLG
jgi:hypothetical protein